MKLHKLLIKIRDIFPFLEKDYLNLRAHFNDMFYVIEIETITACNRKCPYCPNSLYDRGDIKNKKLMKEELFYKIIDDLKEMNFRGIIHLHFFGEPLLDKRLADLVKHVKEKLPKTYASIFSNGDLLDIPTYEKLINSGVDEFEITQHGKERQENVEEIIRLNKSRGDKINIIYNRGIEVLKGLNNRAGLIDFAKFNVKKINQKKNCVYPSKFVNVDYAGKVVLCCMDYFSTIILGDLNKQNLKEIWNKPPYKKLRKDLRKGKFNLKMCQDCKIAN